MQQETQNPPQDDEAEASPSRQFLDDIRSYAAEHRALWQKNYAAFADEYGDPRARLADMAADMRAVLERVRQQAKLGYRRVDREVARKTEGTSTPSSNGASANGADPSD